MTFRQKCVDFVTDPGLGYAVVNTILFSATGWAGFVFCFAVTVLIAVVKAAALVLPGIGQGGGKFRRWLFDDRFPLQASGLILIAVSVAVAAGTGSTIAATAPGFADFAVAAFWPVCVPVLTSLSFAIADFRFAESIRQARLGLEDEDTSIARLVLARPDSYVALGTLGAGLMAGGWSLLAFPFVFWGYALTLRNIRNKSPEYLGHPKIFFVLAAFVFCIVGFVESNVLAAIANGLAGLVMLNIEIRITPGGWPRLKSDMRKTLTMAAAA